MELARHTDIMELIEQILSAGAMPSLVLGAVLGAAITAALHVVRRIKRLIRTAALLAVAGGLGVGGSSQLLHAALTTWR